MTRLGSWAAALFAMLGLSSPLWAAPAGDYPWPAMMWNGGWYGMFLGPLMMILFVAVIVVLVGRGGRHLAAKTMTHLVSISGNLVANPSNQPAIMLDFDHVRKISDPDFPAFCTRHLSAGSGESVCSKSKCTGGGGRQHWTPHRILLHVRSLAGFRRVGVPAKGSATSRRNRDRSV